MTEWIIPCNLKYYDVKGAFSKFKAIDWKKSAKNICVGDIVYIYVGKPISAIKYKCRVNKTNLSKVEIDDSEFVINGENYENYGNHMELELIREYAGTELTRDMLVENGLKGNIQGPRRVDVLIQESINKV
jgi:hypothetical protein